MKTNILEIKIHTRHQKIKPVFVSGFLFLRAEQENPKNDE
jgi:hypothetical protein